LKTAVGIAVVLAACAPAVPTAGQEAVLRFTGAPLSRSVQNESDAAIDRACAWLLAAQSPDGSWCADAKTTALCLLALAGDGAELSPATRAAIDRGLGWLEAAPAPQASLVRQDAQREGGWPALALAVFGRSPLPVPLPMPPLPPPEASEAERAFWFAHAVNRALGGELPAAAEEPADWRAPLANRWTTTQEIDVRGRGHWRASVPDTAFAILLLKEL